MKRRGLLSQKAPLFIRHLMNKGQVYGPVKNKTQMPEFAQVDEPSRVVLDYTTTVLPPKRLFQPPEETIYHFSRKDFTVEPAKVSGDGLKILVGLHNYDAEGIACLDYQMARGPADEGWAARRRNWVFVGVSYEPDQHHFSPSVGIGPDHRNGLDLFMDKADGGYNVELLTERGASLLDGFGGWSAPLPETPAPKFHNRLLPMPSDLPHILARSYEHPIWQQEAKRCFSCGSCTMVCPTCYCFDVFDELQLDMESGEKKRHWDSCQVAPFTEVAGGEIFRKETSSRVRHRIYRKFKYITDHYGRPFCIGCGRCIRACPAKISISEVMNNLARKAAG
ncbi:MAG: 4Fe-4S dicluster domain-containing protein [Deltaproteobacteria bacterium]|nr:4Fe-4S dicluster domain-containing protein [Deltaproteobacteria bacterium]